MLEKETLTPPKTSLLERAQAKIIRTDAPEFEDPPFLEIPTPRVKELQDRTRHIVFLGCVHTNEPESEMIKEVQKRRDQLVASTPASEVLFMIEGHHGGISKKMLTKKFSDTGVTNENEAIKMYGESGALMWYAHCHDIEITSPEIPESFAIEEIKKKGFSNEEIALYLMMRQFTTSIGRKYPLPKGESPARYFGKMFYSFQILSGASFAGQLPNEEEIKKYSPDELEHFALKICQESITQLNSYFAHISGDVTKKLIPSLQDLFTQNTDAFPMNDINELFDPVDPTHRKSKINEISAEIVAMRDHFLIKKINEAMQGGKKILITFGASHLTSIEPALDELFKK